MSGAIPRITALLPMKAHSERVHGKNLRPLGGKPLCHWILDTLQRCPHVSDILVDTDSDEIARVVLDFSKVFVVMRPKELLGDMVGINPLIEQEIRHSKSDWFLQTHSTNPLLREQTLTKAIEAFFAQKEHDSLFSVTPIHARLYRKDASAINHDPKNMLRTQDLPPVYEENSNFYIFSRKSFTDNFHRIGAKPMMWPMEKLEAVDIDFEEDFALAEALAKNEAL